MENKSVRELQDEVEKFVNERDWQTPPGDILTHMVEELGEVARNVLYMKNYGNRNSSEKSNMDEELADLLYLLLKMSNECKIDLGEAFKHKMEKNIRRFPTKK